MMSYKFIVKLQTKRVHIDSIVHDTDILTAEKLSLILQLGRVLCFYNHLRVLRDFYGW